MSTKADAWLELLGSWYAYTEVISRKDCTGDGGDVTAGGTVVNGWDRIPVSMTNEMADAAIRNTITKLVSRVF